jgi:NAD(P)-dependent dehydrogenase (short-subunit alcohol dehydrogenase family)
MGKGSPEIDSKFAKCTSLNQVNAKKMNVKFEKKPVALVTGAQGGIGRAICDAFSSSGCRVIGVDHRENTNFDGHWVNFDLIKLHTDRHLSIIFFDKIKKISNGHLNALVNNAAIQIVKPLIEITYEDWNLTLNTNLLAPFWLTQKLYPLLRRSKGCVINVASIHASLTKSHFCLYSTSKGALVSLTRSLAIDCSPDVRVNSILPAATDTNMLRDGFKNKLRKYNELKRYHPLERIAKPEEVAHAAVFLASNSASFITGTSLSIDGGIGVCLHDPSTT